MGRAGVVGGARRRTVGGKREGERKGRREGRERYRGIGRGSFLSERDQRKVGVKKSDTISVACARFLVCFSRSHSPKAQRRARG